MRGPGLRTLCDIRRTWKCPRCGYVRRASAAETSVRCHCTAEEPFMRLVESQRPERKIAQPLDLSWEYVPDPSEETESPTLPAEEPVAAIDASPALAEPVEQPVIESAPMQADLEDESDDDSAESEPLDQVDGEVSESSPDAKPGPAKKKKRRKRHRRPPEAS